MDFLQQAGWLAFIALCAFMCFVTFRKRPPPPERWVVMNGAGTKYRTLVADRWSWTQNLREAIVYRSSAHANAAHSEDDAAWAIIQISEKEWADAARP